MITISPLKEDDIDIILEWNKNRDPDYLFQWAGNGYTFPLTRKQLRDKIIECAGEHIAEPKSPAWKVFSIIDTDARKMIGTIELSRIEIAKQQAWISRFLIGEEQNRNRGTGSQVLKLLTGYAFRNFGIRRFLLKVFDFNKNAICCYKNTGFEIIKYLRDVRQTEHGTWSCYIMELRA